GSTLGLDTATSVNAQIEVTWPEHFMGALMTYDWKGVQFGVGAAVQSTKLHLVQENPFNVNLRSETSAQAVPLGLILDLGYRYPVIGRVAVDLQVQARRFRRMALPGGGTYLNARVADNRSFVGLGLSTEF